MARVLVGYYSRSGNTRKLAETVAAAIEAGGHAVDCKEVGDIEVDSLTGYDGIILGTPVYYGTMAAEVKKLLDESVKLHGRLDGKVVGAFSSSANIGGGNETAVTDIIHALLIHGMIVQGDPKGDHYGPVAINSPDKRASENAMRWP